MVATVSRTQPHVVSFVVDSVTTDRVALRRQMSPLVLADIFLLYVAPVAFDMSNGAAYNFPKDTIRPGVGSLSAGMRRLPVSDGVFASAVVSSAMLGFGSGHAVLDFPTRRFLALDLVAGTVAFTGLALGMGGQNTAGATLFFGGGGLLIGSHIWQIADLVKRTDPTGR